MANEVSIYEPRTMGRVVQKLPPVRTFLEVHFSDTKKHSQQKKLTLTLEREAERLRHLSAA